jgi:hypothetical protein
VKHIDDINLCYIIASFLGLFAVNVESKVMRYVFLTALFCLDILELKDEGE